MYPNVGKLVFDVTDSCVRGSSIELRGSEQSMLNSVAQLSSPPFTI